MKKVKISICCQTYNHENYIRQCLDSILMQRGDFEMEVLIHDDASTDATKDIIQEYNKKYPGIIHPIIRDVNLYSQGYLPGPFNYERATGEFIAICEGDDYWTCPDKLQKQLNAFKVHPEYDMCFHKAQVKSSVIGFQEYIAGDYTPNINQEVSVIHISDIISKQYGMIPSASLMLKKEVLMEFVEESRGAFKNNKNLIGDVYIHMLACHRSGGALFINEAMSVYNIYSGSSYSSMYSNTSSPLIRWNKFKKPIIQCILLLNEKYSGYYSKSLSYFINKVLLSYYIKEINEEALTLPIISHLHYLIENHILDKDFIIYAHPHFKNFISADRKSIITCLEQIDIDAKNIVCFDLSNLDRCLERNQNVIPIDALLELDIDFYKKHINTAS